MPVMGIKNQPSFRYDVALCLDLFCEGGLGGVHAFHPRVVATLCLGMSNGLAGQKRLKMGFVFIDKSNKFFSPWGTLFK